MLLTSAFPGDESDIIRYKRSEDARMALEQMEGFELAGRTVCAHRSLMEFLTCNRDSYA